MGTRKQPPRVDTSACFCRVDGGLKTVAGARKFVPGSKHCVQTNVIPYPNPIRRRASEGGRNCRLYPLLPGLPDDLAIGCLIRVPRAHHRKLRLVCKRWRRLMSGNYLYSLRKNLGFAEEWLYIIKRGGDGRISWDAFDPIHQHWHPLPPIPGDYIRATGFGCAALSGCHLYLFGGRDPAKGSMKRVIFYSARTNKWHRAPDMLRRRHFFGSSVINNCLYVAGGCSLRSSEVYDPDKNCWSSIADLSDPLVPIFGAVHNERWILKGIGPHQQVLNQIYSPETNAWCSIFGSMVEGWKNPCTSLNGKMYAVDCKDGCRLRAYDEGEGSWSRCGDGRMHLGSSKAVEAAALVPLRGKLCVVRNDRSIILVDVEGEDGWEMIAGRGSVWAFVANLWSKVASQTAAAQRSQSGSPPVESLFLFFDAASLFLCFDISVPNPLSPSRHPQAAVSGTLPDFFYFDAVVPEPPFFCFDASRRHPLAAVPEPPSQLISASSRLSSCFFPNTDFRSFLFLQRASTTPWIPQP